MNIKLKAFFGLIVLAIALILIFTAMMYFSTDSQNAAVKEIAVLLICGTGFLILFLAIMVGIIYTLGLSQPGQPLGLPEGSIRAIIAVFLILIFAVMALFLYTNIALPATYMSKGITQEQVDKIPPDQILSIQPSDQPSEDTTLFDVERKVERSAASEDIAKQVITAMITLVTAISAFYFGTKATPAKEPTKTTSKPVIEHIDPPTHPHVTKHTDVSITITGKDLDDPEKIKLVNRAKDEMKCDIIKSSADEITAMLKMETTHPQGKYDVVVVNKDGKEGRLKDGFEIT
jgi:cytoskeletal protein RodZ